MNTKSIILKCFIIALFTGTMISCETDDNVQSESQTKNPFNSVQIDNPNTKNRLIQWMKDHQILNKTLISEKETIPSFNLDDLHLVSKNNGENSAIVANQIGFDINNKSNFGLAFFQNKNDKIVTALIVKTKNITNNIKQVSYYNINGDLGVKIELNFATKQADIIYQNKMNNVQNKVYKVALCSGQETMDCITDSYSNHGWWSVGLGLITAFQPEAAVGVAIICAVDCGNAW